MSRSSNELLHEALVHLELATGYADGQELEQVFIDAICMRLSAGIEVLEKLKPDERQRIFGATWPLMWGMRNRIAHGYLLVSGEIVRRTAEVDLPHIVEAVRRELDH